MQDLRSFLKVLEEKGDLLKIKNSVSLKWEIGDINRQVNDELGSALYFENIKECSDAIVVTNVLGSPARVAWALGCEQDEVVQTYLERCENTHVPVRIAPESAPCKEVIIPGKQVDLYKLPIPVWHPKDGGPYITMGIQITKDPETGVPTASIIRQMVVGKQEICIQLLPGKHIYMQYQKQKEQGKPLEIAIVIGTGPALIFAATFPGTADENELAIAGGLMQESLEVVKCETIDLEVPAHAEYVIEGILLPDKLQDEGPFGEFTGYYSSFQKQHPVMQVTCITHRKNPIFQGTYEGKPPVEDAVFKTVPYSATILRDAGRLCPFLLDVYVTVMGGCCMNAVAKIRKSYPGHAKQAMHAIWGTHIGKYIKNLTIVDHDVDIRDAGQVECAVAFQVQPHRDFTIESYGTCMVLDPSIGSTRVTSKSGIDATRKLPEEGGPALTEQALEIDHSLSLYWRKIQEKGLKEYLGIS